MFSSSNCHPSDVPLNPVKIQSIPLYDHSRGEPTTCPFEERYNSSPVVAGFSVIPLSTTSTYFSFLVSPDETYMRYEPRSFFNIDHVCSVVSTFAIVISLSPSNNVTSE